MTSSVYPKETVLKDQTPVTIRPMAPDDFERVRTFFQALPRADRLFLRDDVTRAEVLQGWFAHLDYDWRFPLMALHQGAVVGHALLEREAPAWSPHVAEIRVVVADTFKKKAVGTLLARELFDQAKAKGYEKIVARMMETQTGAKLMFEHIGFQTEAVLKSHVKDLDGKKHNLVVMSCELDAGWAKMEDMLQDFAPWGG